MRLPTLFAAAVALGLAGASAATPAFARPMSQAESQKMETAVGVYLRSIGRGEAERVVASLPPRVKNIFAGSAGIEASKLDATLVAQTDALLKSAKFDNFSADYKGVEANDSVLADGTRVTWVVVPTEFTASTAKGKTLNRQPLLAVNEAGKWYMMRVEGQQQKQLVSIAYPFLKDVAFPESSVTPIQ